MSNPPTFLFDLPHAKSNVPTTARKVHLRRLNDVMNISIERGDLQRARRAWSILARCKEYNWKVMWRTGLLLIGDVVSVPARNENVSLEYLRATMLHYPEEQESALKEIILRLATSGKYREALDELDLYLPSYPYQDNPVLHTYAGLLSLRLAMCLSEDQTVPVVAAHAINQSLLRESQNHFERALALDPDNAVPLTFLQPISEYIQTAGHGPLQPMNLSDDDMDVDGDIN